MRAVFIYALIDPRTEEIRYVGKTTDLEKRLSFHLLHSKIEKCHRAHWICSLTAQGVIPKIEALAQVPESDWQQWEIDYITAFRSIRARLTNNTPGGDAPPILCGEANGFFGKKHTPETRQKISTAIKDFDTSGKRNPFFGKKHSPESLEKMSRRGSKLTSDHKSIIGKVAQHRWDLWRNDMTTFLEYLERN